ncbi:flavin reductase family protein [Arthrobacter sp. Marseille-P9274]|uniref:flavin reductase family protein n=1 Tax=Arthrobacter sp. Marseille-P9274 TaxID=2866572 RepID=UPI0021C60FC3|nr:flavin reductase family protein [Arthrobacter sp. Marseille-P9274]
MTPLTMPTDPLELRSTYSCFPSGVVALCGDKGGRPTGMSVSSFTTVSLEPALVSVSVQKTSTTWPQLRQLPRLGISVLAEDQGTVCRALAGRGDRFQNIGWRQTTEGAIFIDGAAATFDCSIVQEIEAGDHVIVLLEVEAMGADRSRQPLVFHHSDLRRLTAA